MIFHNQLHTPLKILIHSSYHKPLDHLIELDSYTYSLDISKSISSSRHHANFGDSRLQDWTNVSSFKHNKKILLSTLVNYDEDCASRALSSREGMRGSIHILILNIFGYDTPDPVVQSIYLYS